MENRRIKEKLTKIPESGAIAVIMAAAMIVICGFAALAIDIGQIVWVKGELAKAADAGALAGARALLPYTGTPLAPNWTQAQTMATQTVQQNQAAAQSLTDCQVQTGYWSLTNKTLQSTSIVVTSTDVPAVRVQIFKNSANNGGPLQMMFAPVLGFNTVDVQAQTTAMISFPKGMPVGSLFPLAVAETIVNQYWDQDPPVSFPIGDASNSGQWTSFQNSRGGGASDVADLINYGNPISLNLQDPIYLLTGVVASNYGNAETWIGKTAVIPLVNISLNPTPVLGFVAFRIEHVQKTGSDKYIQGHFDKDFDIINAATIGPPTPDTLSNPNPPQIVN